MLKFSKTEFTSFYFICLGILTVEVCFAIDSRDGSYDDCNVRGGEICYFVGSHIRQTWYTAHRVCQDKNSSLPIIRSSEEQTAFETYLKTLSSNALRTIWTAGKKQVYNEWTWINGQTLNESHYPNITMISGSAVKTHMQIYMAHSRNELTPEDPFSQSSYLCQYKDRQCNGQYEVNATNGCLIPSGNGYKSWYGARNECLSNGGDLAILTNKDLWNLKNRLYSHYQYWIGLRKTYWVWQTEQGSRASEEEVKYTKWANEVMPTIGELCISINTTDGHWRASNCNLEGSSVVCEKQVSTTVASTAKTSEQRSVPTSSPASTTTTDVTTAKFTSSTGKTHPSTTIISTSRSSSKHSTTTQTTASHFPSTTPTTTGTSIPSTINEQGDISSTFNTVPAAVGAALAVIVILCIIIVILVVKCRKSKSSKNKTEPAQMDSKTTKDKKPKEENPSAATATEERSIYADIPLAERTANDTVEATPKGTVYASLDFNEGVTYAEPSKLYAKTQNASGAIYAEPLDATGNGTTSAGSSSTADVKIGPMGDVYALPTTNVTPSSAKMTERPIYANT